MDLRQAIMQYIEDAKLAPPCSPRDLEEAERRLGQPLPDCLREAYLVCDGFTGPTRARFLWPLLQPRDGLVDYNLWLRQEDWMPKPLLRFIFFGDGGIGPSWGVDPSKPLQVIEWDGEWGEDYEIAGSSPFEAWCRSQRLYDAARRELGR